MEALEQVLLQEQVRHQDLVELQEQVVQVPQQVQVLPLELQQHQVKQQYTQEQVEQHKAYLLLNKQVCHTVI
jgi:hypothetical protein